MKIPNQMADVLIRTLGYLIDQHHGGEVELPQDLLLGAAYELRYEVPDAGDTLIVRSIREES